MRPQSEFSRGPTPNPRTVTRHYSGLDLGQAHETTALAVLEKMTEVRDDSALPATYAVRHLERFMPGTPYPAVFNCVTELLSQPPLRECPLVVDQTGVGKAVMSLLRAEELDTPLVPVLINAASHHADVDNHGVWVLPRKELVATLQVLLQTRRLRVAESLEHASTLVRELAEFKAKPLPVGADPLSAWREGQHDDLMFAVAIAAWRGERTCDWAPEVRPVVQEQVGLWASLGRGRGRL